MAMNSPFFFGRKNYNVEQHIVRTLDDYLLCVHRIPSVKSESFKREKSPQPKKDCEVIDNLDKFIQQKAPKVQGYKGKPVVLLQHGFLMSSEVWVSNTKEYNNLPYVLVKQGYDVWLGNARGNKYSQYHVHLSPRHQPFWNFSLNEFAMRDLPDTVDVSYRLCVPKKKNLLTPFFIVYFG
jgi:lysosomal acid lipase/cholesteryl ester hydrolase